MKIGVLVCDPGDRPEFTEQYRHLIRYQTRKAYATYFVDEPRKDDRVDLVTRMRRGGEALKNSCDLIVIVENDDFYSRNYFERMAVLWERYDRPPLIGFSETIYYHLITRKFVTIKHPHRASLFTTCIAAASVDSIVWPAENEVFVDLRLWEQFNGVAIPPAVIEAIGIKHGQGRIVSQGQKKDFHRYGKEGIADENMDWLRARTGSQFDFYFRMSERLRKMEAETVLKNSEVGNK